MEGEGCGGGEVDEAGKRGCLDVQILWEQQMGGVGRGVWAEGGGGVGLGCGWLGEGSRR